MIHKYYEIRRVVHNLFDRAQVVDDRRCFLIASHGQTATFWLAINLNNHPDIYCTHSYYYPLLEPHIKLKMQQERFRFDDSINKHFWKLTVGEFLRQHARASTKPIIGNVHAFHVGRVLKWLQFAPRKLRSNLKIVNLIRHPVSRTESAYKTWYGKGLKLADWMEHEISNPPDLLQFVRKNYPQVDLNDSGERIFLAAIRQAIHICDEAKQAEQHGILNYRHEDITQSPDHFATLFEDLTGRPSVHNQEYVNQVFQSKATNKHNPENDETCAAIFERWAKWQRALFLYVMEQYDMHDFYQKQGYYSLS